MISPTSGPHRSERLDRLGAVASGLCAAHCAICASLPAAFGAVGLGALLSHEAEWAFTLVAVMLGAGASLASWRRYRSIPVAGLLILGIVGLLAARGLEMSSGHPEEHPGDPQPGVERATSLEHSDALGLEGPRAESSRGHGAPQDAHDDTTHRAGAAVGLFAGLLLMLGHILNLRKVGQSRTGCCA